MGIPPQTRKVIFFCTSLIFKQTHLSEHHGEVGVALLVEGFLVVGHTGLKQRPGPVDLGHDQWTGPPWLPW